MNILAKLKRQNSNFYIFLIMICLPLWVNSVNGLINHFLPNRTLLTLLIMAVIPLIILVADDGSLDEFYKYDDNSGTSRRNLLITSGYDYQSK